MNTSMLCGVSRRAKVALGAFLVALLAAIGLAFTPAPATAATLANMLAFNGFHVGEFRASNGDMVYCLEPAAHTPFSTQKSPHRVSSLPGYTIDINDEWGWSGRVTTSATTPEQVRQMNWLMSERGTGVSAARAAEVQLAIWEIRRESGNAAWIDGKHELISRFGGAAHIAAGKALAAEARSRAAGPGKAVPSSELSLTLADSFGTGTVAYPAGTTELRIEGGTFANGKTTLAITDSAAGSAEWTATLHDDGWSRHHAVSVSGSWALEETFWPAELMLYPAEIVSEQLLGAGVSSVQGMNTGEFSEVNVTLDSRFTPVISTQTPEFFVERGKGSFSDSVFVATNFGDASTTPWPRSGDTYLPLEAHGTLYGPFTAPQPESDDAPASAPVAERKSLMINRGPGEYTVRTDSSVREAGYYYWVWEIAEAAQSDEIRKSELLEFGGVYADKFGAKEESQLVPTELRWITKLKEHTLSPENLVLDDSIRVSLHGGAWVRDENGDRVPANIRFTVYQTEEAPVRQTLPPRDAREIGQFFTEVVEQDTWIHAPRFDIPKGTTGWVTIRACLLSEDQPEHLRGYLSEWCDDFGVPEETANIELSEPEEEEKPETPEAPEAPEALETPDDSEDPLANTGGNGLARTAIAGSGVLVAGMLVFLLAGLRRKDARALAQEGELHTN